jgi:putative oxidoreductase
MTIIALYAFQAFTGILFLAAGYAKLAGMDFMLERLAMVGLGTSAVMIVGCLEIVAGLFLLFPRAGPVGAVLVGALMFGTIGTIAGHAVSRGLDPRHGVDFQLRHTAASTARI